MEEQKDSQSNANSQASETVTYSREEYENLCKTVGNLYISLVNVRQEAENQYGSRINSLTTQVQQLMYANKDLQEKLAATEPSCCDDEEVACSVANE